MRSFTNLHNIYLNGVPPRRKPIKMFNNKSSELYKHSRSNKILQSISSSINVVLGPNSKNKV